MMHGDFLFADRQDAGRKLAAKLSAYSGKPGLLVLALPRGGVPVAFEVARALSAPLDIFLVRKLGVPGHEELAMGAIASDDVIVLNDNVVEQLDISQEEIEMEAQRESLELKRREQLYRRGRPAYDLSDKNIIIVDDGLATGASMRAAATAVGKKNVKSFTIAVPVAAPETYEEFLRDFKNVICIATPRYFASVGNWYADFSQTSDKDVEQLLDQAAQFFHAA